jgi:hypothetical protein
MFVCVVSVLVVMVVVVRGSYVVLGVDVSPSLQEELHDVRITLSSGQHQGRVAVLQSGAGCEGLRRAKEGQA